MRGQVRPLGITMIVVGTINVIFYLLYAALSVAGTGLQFMQQGKDFGLDDPESLGNLAGSGMGLVLVALWVLGGVLWIAAGARLMSNKNRIFAIVVLILGCIPCCLSHLCCTWVLNLGVAIWGLIVLFNSDTELAFREESHQDGEIW